MQNVPIGPAGGAMSRTNIIDLNSRRDGRPAVDPESRRRGRRFPIAYHDPDGVPAENEVRMFWQCCQALEEAQRSGDHGEIWWALDDFHIMYLYARPSVARRCGSLLAELGFPLLRRVG